MKMMEKEFESYWKKHSVELLKHAPAALLQERTNTGKMNTAGDWMLFALPVVVAVGIVEHKFFTNEIANLLVGMAAGGVMFVITMFIKPYVTGKRNVTDIDEDIMQHFYRIYQEGGIEALKNLNS